VRAGDDGGPHVGDDLGGDPACWLGRVCAECGALIEGPRGTACWRCGRMPADEEEHDV
jgi:hypothetical protein